MDRKSIKSNKIGPKVIKKGIFSSNKTFIKWKKYGIIFDNEQEVNQNKKKMFKFE